ncbi:MAG: hypothetical protein WCH79_04985 [Planctomycetia bacterium]
MHGARVHDPIVRGLPRAEWPAAPLLHGAAPRSGPRRVLWVGMVDDDELSMARSALVRLTGCAVTRLASPAAGLTVRRRDSGSAGSLPPLDCILLAVDRPGRWSTEDALALAQAFPLTPIFAIASSLCDGRRRSGPPLPGIEELPWHDAAGRLARWFFDLDAGLPGSLGLAPTVRREDRFLEAPTFQPHSRPAAGQAPVTVAARTALDLDGLADLLAAAGHPIVQRTLGRPELSPPGRLVVWDAGRLDGADLEWLRLLVANRPSVAVVVLDSFPRGDSGRGVLRAGGAALLGRPVALEVLAGTLRGLAAVTSVV